MTDDESVSPWGKLAPDGRAQPLAGHCRDVAAVFSALLRLPGMRARLARLAGTGDFRNVWIERLAWFVFLHDLGKVNRGFQARRDAEAPPVGHVRPIAGNLAGVCAAIGAERLAGWADDSLALDDWFHAVLSHHGKPWTVDLEETEKRDDRRFAAYWRSSDGYDPMRALTRLTAAADAMFPAAFRPAPPIPLKAPLVHALSGLAMLADWIASSDWQNSPAEGDLQRWACDWLVRIGLDPSLRREALAAAPPDFVSAFGFAPNPAQTAFSGEESQLAILESETGSGKTEAALWRFLTRFRAGAVDGLYFALPTRTAAVQLHGRIERLLARLWPDSPPPCVLAVPGYLDDDRAGALPDARDDTDASEDDARGRPVWAAEHPKRYFAGMIGVGTIDQALLAAMRTRHAHMRGAALMRLMLVVDEVHASDAYMASLVEELLAAHLAAGGEAALLSATLGARARVRYASIGVARNLADIAVPSLEAAVAAPYPAVTTNRRIGGAIAGIAAAGREKSVAIAAAGLIDAAEAIAARALEVAGQGGKVLVVRNTVAGAVAVQEALERLAGPDSPLLFRVGGVATLHHGRFAREDRRLLDRAVEAAIGKARPAGGMVIAGSQTLEQSLDIDADFLITDLCPMDVLLQRLGRLHRHAFEPDGRTPRLRPVAFAEPQALVLTPPDDLASLLGGRRRGRDAHGLGPMRDASGVPRGVYPDVVALELTRRLCCEQPLWNIPAMNRDLVERSLHPEAQAALVATMPEAERPGWQAHLNDISGVRFGDGSAARQCAIRRDLPFMDRRNAILAEEHIATRFGEEGLLVDLADGTMGPFGETIRKLAIPAWWRIKDCVPIVIPSTELYIRFEEKTLLYSRLGLFLA